MVENAIDIEGLRKSYGQGADATEALKGVDLAIPAGSIFGLLGPNGAGKSTLINILAGLVLKTAGKVRIWGFDQDVNPRQSRAAIGVMPQELNLDPFFTPRQTLELQAGLYGVPRARRRTDAILAMVGLENQAGAYARALSGGMRRRLLLAKAIVHAPPVLVLDEPTAGVDIELRQMLWENVRGLNAQGVTVILTTHYLEEAEAICEEIAIIDRGRLIARDRTDRLVARLDDKTLVVTTEDPLATLPPLPEGVRGDLRGAHRLALSYARNRVPAGRILDALAAADIRVADLTVEEADLEDVFVALTRAARDRPA